MVFDRAQYKSGIKTIVNKGFGSTGKNWTTSVPARKLMTNGNNDRDLMACLHAIP